MIFILRKNRILTHTYIHTHIRTYIHTHTHTHTHIYACIHTYIHNTYIHTYIHNTYIHTYIIHTYIHTCIRTYSLCIPRVQGSVKTWEFVQAIKIPNMQKQYQAASQSLQQYERAIVIEQIFLNREVCFFLLIPFSLSYSRNMRDYMIRR